jgi:hypothetical protein
MPDTKHMLWIAVIAIVAVIAYNRLVVPNLGLPQA